LRNELTIAVSCSPLSGRVNAPIARGRRQIESNTVQAQ
jgi:hypothetical protein